MRGLWTAACLIGAVVCTALVAFNALALYEARDNTSAIPGLIGWMLTFGAAGGACVVGLFRSRADIERDMQDEPARPAKWIEEMRAQQKRGE